MQYHHLGNSDLKVSEISFGCMSLGEDHADNKKLLHQAFDRGINLFDTADLYQQGENEVSLGKAFKGMRQHLLLATKVGNQWRSDGSGWDWNPRKAYIIKAVEGSLRRLQTDYIDLYQLHGGTLEDPIQETIDAFELLKKEGKIRAYGISSIRPNVIREYVQHSQISSVMMQYSLLDRRPEESCLALLQEHAISVLSRGAYAQGLLTGKTAKPYLNHTQKEVEQAAAAIQNVAEQTQQPAAVVAARFALQHPAVTTAVTGIRQAQQLEDAISAGQSAALTEEHWQTLAASAKAETYEKHR